MSDTQKHNKPNVPNLRFPEFSGEWHEVALNELAPNISSGNSKQSDGIYQLIGSTGIIGTTCKPDYQGKMILVARVGANAGYINYFDGKCGITDNTLIVRPNIQSIDYCKYIYYYLNHIELNRYVFGSGQPLITGGMLKRIKVSFGSISEIKKISQFLSLLDQKIAIQNKVIEDLKSLYDVICQKLYSPNDKLGWQEFKYSDIFTISNERNSRLQYTNVLSASQEYGMIERGELNIDIKFDAASIKNYKIVRPNEYVIHLRSFQGGFAYSDKTGICSPAYTILLPNERLIPSFLKYYFTSIRFINSLRIVTYGIRDGRSISVEEFLQLKIAIPSIPEQHHIVNAMQLWEDMIRIEECHLSNLQKQKQYLLRQMFI